MKRYKRIGVYLTGSPADRAALSYAGRIAELAGSEHVLCVHGYEVHDCDDTVDEQAVSRYIREALPASVVAITEIQSGKGQGVAAILKSARDLELDLLVKGRRLPAHQLATGSTFTRLARKSPCSVLVVPNGAYTHLARMLVPVDGSKHARLAVDVALDIARTVAAVQRPQMVVETIYNIPYGYRHSGATLREAEDNYAVPARKMMDETLRDFDFGDVPIERILMCSEDLPAAICESAAVRKMDLILMGSRGMTMSAAVLLGSTAERVLSHATTSVLIVKEKGETVSLLNALFGGG